MGADDVDDASAALIAQMLQEDQMANPYLGVYESESSEDYDDGSWMGKGKKRKAKKKAPKAAAKPAKVPKEAPVKTPKSAADKDCENEKGDKERKEKSMWSKEEEEKFYEGLELYGREWAKTVEHIGTVRDVQGVKSKAQKWFIKLYVAGKPVPPKVAESGAGHTLSGKPLDPEGGATIAYGGPEYRKWLSERKEKGLSLVPDGLDKIPAPPPKPPKPEKAPKPEKKKKEVQPKVQKPTKVLPPTDSEYAETGRTGYAKRSLRTTRKRNTKYTGLEGQPFMMMECKMFSGDVGSNTKSAQPYHVRVAHDVLLAMDFHAHLTELEIIGFLGGTWDAEKKILTISDVFPCNTEHSEATSVEMDATQEVIIRQQCEERDLSVVGWYHSHPVFEPNPSNVDVENQSNYQDLFKNASSKGQPFVGAIVGPYDTRMPTAASVFNWFIVRNTMLESNVPMKLEVETYEKESFLSQDLSDRLTGVVDFFRTRENRVDFGQLWRMHLPNGILVPAVSEAGEDAPQAAPMKLVSCNRLEKLNLSLKSRRPDNVSQEAFVEKVSLLTEELWDGAYKQDDEEASK